ncbi:MAG: DMT family transporter [Bacteroidia bacterium]|nr:DMT family transporter [Bacteroidia bacterium]MDW8157847.1 DMT family transporter [Bacteroidia bacterium]
MKKKNIQVILLLSSCVLIWGSSFILMKNILLVYSPMQVGALRLFFASCVLLPLAISYLLRNNYKKYPILHMIISGLCGSMIPAFLFPLAQTQISSSTSGALNSLTPLFTLLLGTLFFQIKISFTRLLGVLIGLIGAFSILLLGEVESGKNYNLGFGIFAILATLLYAINVNFVNKYLLHISSLELASISLSFSLIPTTMYLLYSDFLDLTYCHPLAGRAILSAFILGVLGTALASFLFYNLLRLSSPVFASSVTYLIPVVALAWGIYYGEWINIYQIVGSLLILVGVWLVNK